MRRQVGTDPRRPGAVAQIVDLAFPFSLHEQAPFVSRGVPAVTITTGDARPRAPERDTLAVLDQARQGDLGPHSQAQLGSREHSAG